MTREPVCVNAHDRSYEGGPCHYCEVQTRKNKPLLLVDEAGDATEAMWTALTPKATGEAA
jgi:hypothetical protein